eukprot:g68994.t1
MKILVVVTEGRRPEKTQSTTSSVLSTKTEGQKGGDSMGAEAFCLLLLAFLALQHIPVVDGLKIKVMAFNIFYGGTSLNLTDRDYCHPIHGCPQDLKQIARAVEVAQADVVCFCETDGNTETIASVLGWPYFCPRTHTVSKFPLWDPPVDQDWPAVFVEVEPQKVILVSTMHALSTPYGPYMVHDGYPRESVLQLETDFRLPRVQSAASTLIRIAEMYDDCPAILAGDFNCPSYLDWTPEAVAQRNLSYPMPWPISVMLQNCSFSDSFRAVRSNPITDPGFTWTSGGPEGNGPDEVFDRVDYVYTRGSIRVLSSKVVGENGPYSDLILDPWPSDHRGLVSELAVDPVPMPELVRVSSRNVKVGDSVWVDFQCNFPPCKVFVTQVSGKDRVIVAKFTTSHEQINTSSFQPGTYDVILVSNQGETKNTFWLYPTADGDRVILSIKDEIVSGVPFAVQFSNAPGMLLDLIGIFSPKDNSTPVVYQYTGGRVEGSVSFAPPFYNEYNNPLWPLPADKYVVQFMLDDSLYIDAGKDLYIQVEVVSGDRMSILQIFLWNCIRLVVLGMVLWILILISRRRS